MRGAPDNERRNARLPTALMTSSLGKNTVYDLPQQIRNKYSGCKLIHIGDYDVVEIRTTTRDCTPMRMLAIYRGRTFGWPSFTASMASGA